MRKGKMAELRKHAVLIGAGESDACTAERIKRNLYKDDFVIALDGGLALCAEHGITPDRIVGDFDSLPATKQELLEQYPQEIIHRLPCEKDDTDTLAALRMAVEMGYESFTIYGGLGGRFSHTVANIQSLLYLKDKGLQGELVGNNSRIFLVKDESILLQAKENGYISVFAFSQKAQGVTLKNLKYEIRDVELTNSFPVGVSNEFIGKEAEISVRNGVLLVVEEWMG